MDTASLGAELLVAAATEYAPRDRGGGVAHLEGLRLFVRVRQVQAMDSGFIALFISEVDASAGEGQPGITITGVGMGPDMRVAVGDAIGQWSLGVLPVLAHWRGKHSCLSNPRELETRGGRFTVLAGPTIERGGPAARARSRPRRRAGRSGGRSNRSSGPGRWPSGSTGWNCSPASRTARWTRPAG